MLSLTGRTAVITGAATGIGRALAEAAVARGMSVALADIDAGALEEARDALTPVGDVMTEVLDVRDPAAQQGFAARVSERFESIALVFANAGVMRTGTTWMLQASDWDDVLDVNVKGVVHTASAFMPYLLQQEQNSRVVITGSTSAFLSRPHLTAYSASKHALWGIAEAMQQELAQQHAPVAVSMLAPAGVNTSIAGTPVDGAGEKQRSEIHALLAQYGMPAEEVAGRTFDALCAEKFWILPHPDFKAQLQRRAQNVTQERDPQ